jgi:hypothetical protein
MTTSKTAVRALCPDLCRFGNPSFLAANILAFAGRAVYEKLVG